MVNRGGGVITADGAATSCRDETQVILTRA
jgi:hypothetical protein